MIQFHDGWEDDPADPADDDDLDECPRCGRSIDDDDDSERCPRCGESLGPAAAGSGQPWWVQLGAVACLAMVVYWILHP